MLLHWEMRKHSAPAKDNQIRAEYSDGCSGFVGRSWGPHEGPHLVNFPPICDFNHRFSSRPNLESAHSPGWYPSKSSFGVNPHVNPHLSAPEGLEWKEAYLAAVLEKDRTRIVGLIEDARSKLSARLAELDAQSYPHDEIEAIQDADYLLQALQSSLAYRNDLQN